MKCTLIPFLLRNVRGEDYAVVLVSKDRGTKVTNAHVVPNKGASFEWVVKQSIRDLEKMGYYNQVVLKSDGEPALVDLMKQIAAARNGKTVIEHSAPGESKSNGFIERGIQMAEEMIRVYKLDLEKRI